jgi:hypothetical protein
MGMKKGAMTAEHKQKIRDAQHARKLRNASNPKEYHTDKHKLPKLDGKPILYLTGRERCANDMFTAIRNSLRPIGRNVECDRLCMKIANLPNWDKPKELLPILRETFEIKRAL